MAKASITIANGADGFLAHNSRESFSQSQVFFDEKNEISHTKKEAFSIYRSELEKRKSAYEKRTKQKMQKKTITHLSAIVNLEKHHTMADLHILKLELEKKLDSKIFQLAIHRDEGKLVNRESGEILTSGEDFFCNPGNEKLYFDAEFKKEINMEKWDIEKNIHAHFEMLGIDSEGRSIRRSFNNRNLSELQDLTAEILKMERGHKWKPTYTKEQIKEIKSHLKPKKSYKNDKAYGTAFTAMAKELGYYKPRPRKKKRLDTHDFKSAKALENKANAQALAKIADLKKEIGGLRAELTANHAKRPEYAKLEQLNRELKAEITEQKLTIDEMKDVIDFHARALGYRDEAIEELKAENAELKTALTEAREANEELKAMLREPKGDDEPIESEIDRVKRIQKEAREAKEMFLQAKPNPKPKKKPKSRFRP